MTIQQTPFPIEKCTQTIISYNALIKEKKSLLNATAQLKRDIKDAKKLKGRNKRDRLKGLNQDFTELGWKNPFSPWHDYRNWENDLITRCDASEQKYASSLLCHTGDKNSFEEIHQKSAIYLDPELWLQIKSYQLSKDEINRRISFLATPNLEHWAENNVIALVDVVMNNTGLDEHPFYMSYQPFRIDYYGIPITLR